MKQKLRSKWRRKIVTLYTINPLTPVLAITGRDKLWPFFHFWRHHFWPKLAFTEIGPMEPEICTKMPKKLSEKLREEFLATTHGYSMVKVARLYDTFLEVLLTASKPSRRPVTGAKSKVNEKKERWHQRLKNWKAWRRRSLSCLKILLSVHARAKMLQNVMQHVIARTPSFHVVL